MVEIEGHERDGWCDTHKTLHIVPLNKVINVHKLFGKSF